MRINNRKLIPKGAFSLIRLSRCLVEKAKRVRTHLKTPPQQKTPEVEIPEKSHNQKKEVQISVRWMPVSIITDISRREFRTNCFTRPFTPSAQVGWGRGSATLHVGADSILYMTSTLIVEWHIPCTGNSYPLRQSRSVSLTQSSQ